MTASANNIKVKILPDISSFKSWQEKSVYTVITAAFYVLCLAGLATYSDYNILPATPIFELVLFATAALLIRKPRKKIAFFLFISFFYVSLSFAYSAFITGTHILDYAQAYKAFIYIIPLCFFYRRKVFSSDQLCVFVKVLLIFFLLKYSYSIVLNVNERMGSRPAILVENNFELIFLITVFYIASPFLGKTKNFWFLVLAIITVISGSRSSLGALMIAFAGIYLNRLTIKTAFYLFLFLLLTIVVFFIFYSRLEGGDIESIDRFRFMLIFIEETKNWGLPNYAFGTAPVTPLSGTSCSLLGYYQTLFSYSGDGSCYSVILHSYIMRALFDHGLVGLAFLFLFIYRALRGCEYSPFQALCIIGIYFSSALSVSAMNSVFISIATAIALSSYKSEHQ